MATALPPTRIATTKLQARVRHFLEERRKYESKKRELKVRWDDAEAKNRQKVADRVAAANEVRKQKNISEVLQPHFEPEALFYGFVHPEVQNEEDKALQEQYVRDQIEHFERNTPAPLLEKELVQFRADILEESVPVAARLLQEFNNATTKAAFTLTPEFRRQTARWAAAARAQRARAGAQAAARKLDFSALEEEEEEEEEERRRRRRRRRRTGSRSARASGPRKWRIQAGHRRRGRAGRRASAPSRRRVPTYSCSK